MSDMTTQTTQPTSGCPFHHKEIEERPQRKTAEPQETLGARIEQDASGVWRVRGYQEVKALLRAEGTHQAGFRAEQIARMPGTMRPPILFQEGDVHRDQRTKTARFFTPTTTDKKYRDFMTAYADELIAELKKRGRADLSDLSMKLAVQVAAQVVGLTDSYLPGMAQRIEAFFDQRDARSAAGGVLNELRNQWRVGRFFFLDVQPAIRARRRKPREDVISHLLGEGYGGLEILTECITFAAAGMITTREFISAAAWHLLEHPELKERYLVAGEKERHAILHELLRLEPVVGHILRRAQRDLEVDSEGQRVTIPAGSLINLHIYGANADECAVGEMPLTYCSERDRARGVQPYVASFGDGNHRCPGAFIAMQETDIFLTRLLSLEGLKLEHEPQLSRNEVVKGYEIRNFYLRFAG